MSISSSEDETLSVVYESETGFDFSPCDLDVLTLLSNERASQRTKAFADADAVAKLLEEKDKDLELAARIGQQLLEQNRTLEEKIAVLEKEKKNNQESITQLEHDLIFKNELLELFDESSDNTENIKAETITPVIPVTVDLELRIVTLEEDNKLLRAEATRLIEDDIKKTEEKSLQDEATKRVLTETNSKVTILEEELQRKFDEVFAQEEDLLILEDEMKSLQEVNKNLLEENTELYKNIDILESCQDELTTELSDLKENYVQVVSILKETQDQIRNAEEKKESVGADAVSVFHSLAYEIESSMSKHRCSEYFRRTFETVRCVHKNLLSKRSRISCASSSGYDSNNLSDLQSSESSYMEVAILNSNSAPDRMVSESVSECSVCPAKGSSFSDRNWRKLPAKLQIIKPLEGSSTLQVWSALANPNLGTLLDNRTGVQTRAEIPMGEIGMHQMIPLTEKESSSALQKNLLSNPSIFTHLTASTINWNLRGSTTTLFTGNVSTTVSTCSLASSHRSASNHAIPIPCTSSNLNSGTLSCSKSTTNFGMPVMIHSDHDLKMCEKKKNPTNDGNAFQSFFGAVSQLFSSGKNNAP